jgi:hypothetical protein
MKEEGEGGRENSDSMKESEEIVVMIRRKRARPTHLLF